MEPKNATGEQSGRGRHGNRETERQSDSGLQPVLRFWGSYCYADVSDWTKAEVDDLSDSLEAMPESNRRKSLMRDSGCENSSG
jgi:hypothetical protein